MKNKWGNDLGEKAAYYTVEAVFVMTTCIGVLMALLYSGLYLHDHMIVKSEMNQRLAEHFQRGEGEVTTEWRSAVEQSMADKLFLMQIQSLRAVKGLTSVDMTVTYKLPISLRKLQQIFTNGKATVSMTTTRELVGAAKYKWDYDLYRGKE